MKPYYYYYYYYYYYGQTRVFKSIGLEKKEEEEMVSRM